MSAAISLRAVHVARRGAGAVLRGLDLEIAAGETVAVEYKLAAKNNNGGLLLTLSRVDREGKTATFLTRRMVSAGK